MSEKFVLKIFCGVRPTMKIFHTNFFHIEMISFENFPDYSRSKQLLAVVIITYVQYNWVSLTNDIMVDLPSLKNS